MIKSGDRQSADAWMASDEYSPRGERQIFHDFMILKKFFVIPITTTEHLRVEVVKNPRSDVSKIEILKQKVDVFRPKKWVFFVF